jgi:hypothetical protein
VYAAPHREEKTMNLHRSGKYLKRCRATVRQGQGVSGCLLEKDGNDVQHFNSLLAVAQDGGGTIEKSVGPGLYRYTEIVALAKGGFIALTDKKQRVYDKQGKVIPFKKRPKDLRVAGGEKNAPNSLDEAYAAATETAKFAPASLRPYFVPEAVYNESDPEVFAAEWAAHELIGGEADSEHYALAKKNGLLPLIDEAVRTMAQPEFMADDQKWLSSPQRAAMEQIIPSTLARLEDEAEEAWVRRLLAAPATI